MSNVLVKIQTSLTSCGMIDILERKSFSPIFAIFTLRHHHVIGLNSGHDMRGIPVNRD